MIFFLLKKEILLKAKYVSSAYHNKNQLYKNILKKNFFLLFI